MLKFIKVSTERKIDMSEQHKKIISPIVTYYKKKHWENEEKYVKDKR